MHLADWAPMRWPIGPHWSRPESLSLLDGTPINCLLLTPDQLKSEGLATAARSRKIELLEQPPKDKVALPPEAVWPGVQLSEKGNAEAGPTGPPWVDSNGWRCLLARAKDPAKPVWISVDAPEDVRPQYFPLAIADAAAHGGRWVVSLDAATVKAIESGDRSRWKPLADALVFFEARRAWLTLPTIANLGVLSDFEGANEFLATELLNLMPRRFLASRVVDTAHSRAEALRGLKGVVWANEKAPDGEWLRLLTSFAQAGNTVIVPVSAAHLADKLPKGKKHKTGYSVHPWGAGTLAVAPEPWGDPYVVAAEAHLVFSRRFDIYRVFNSGATNVHCTESAGGAVMHVLNYTARPTYNPMSVFLARNYNTARLHTFAGTQELKVNRAAEGVEVNLPAFAAYAAIEFGGQS